MFDFIIIIKLNWALGAALQQGVATPERAPAFFIIIIVIYFY